MGQIDLLYRLQQIDTEIREGKTRLTQIIRLQSESKELVEARTHAESSEASLQTWRGKQNDLNLELRSLEVKAKRSEDRLYSGQVTNPKELEDLQHEIESLGRRRSVLEDELLEAMIMAEEAQAERDQAVEDHSRIRSVWETDQTSFKAEQVELVGRINALSGHRKMHVSMMEPGTVRAYEVTGRRTGNIAVVVIRNGRCTGCQVRVPDNQVKAVDEGKLVNCDSCGRILCMV